MKTLIMLFALFCTVISVNADEYQIYRNDKTRYITDGIITTAFGKYSRLQLNTDGTGREQLSMAEKYIEFIDGATLSCSMHFKGQPWLPRAFAVDVTTGGTGHLSKLNALVKSQIKLVETNSFAKKNAHYDALLVELHNALGTYTDIMVAEGCPRHVAMFPVVQWIMLHTK